MPKSYPSFIIDRCRHIIDGIGYDYIVCTDKTVGFVARAYAVNREQAYAVDDYIIIHFVDDVALRFLVAKFERVSVVLEIVEFLQSPALDAQERSRVRSLLKKAARKYMIHAHKFESSIDAERAIIITKIRVNAAYWRFIKAMDEARFNEIVCE